MQDRPPLIMKHAPLKFPSCLFMLLLLMMAGNLHGQIIFPVDVHHGQSVETCTGVFTDSSLGDTATTYDPGEYLYITFMSNDPDRVHLWFDFDLFSLGEGDTLFVHDGADATAPLLMAATGQELQGERIVSSDGSLFFHFVSDAFDPGDPEFRLGWYANISCKNTCELFVATIDPLDGLKHCPLELDSVSFAASASYMPEHFDYDPNGFVFSWIIEEQEVGGQQVGWLFEEPGAYTVRLIANDPLTTCTAQAVEVLLVATIPELEGTMASADTVCAEEMFTLTGEATPTVWTGFPTAVMEDVPFLIGKHEHWAYESALEFDVFGDETEILSGEDFDHVCIYIEHVDQSQLMFELESPGGVVVQLKAPDGPTANLGEPVVWEHDIPGTPYAYCFSPFPQYGRMAVTTPQFYEYTDNAGNYYFNATHMPEGLYTPEQSLNEFAGSPMNGKWSLRIEDHTLGESGHVFGWSLLFNEVFYPDSLIFIPEIVEEKWSYNGNPIPGNPAVTSLSEPGDHEFLFQVTDNFGCTYDTTITVHLLPLPEAEIVSELEIPICEGDSTLLTVMPINNDAFHWEYQWQIGGTDMPGRTYDTLMVKEPGLYTAMITEYTIVNTDTIHKCINFFEKDVSDQNCDLNIPNVFTPNADGINDLFEIKNLEHYPNAQIVIYNRWGAKVFEHTDYYNNWWDGAGAPDGTYFYVLRYTRLGKTRFAEGTVTIIR